MAKAQIETDDETGIHNWRAEWIWWDKIGLRRIDN